ncbi:MAG TPA: phosphatidylglycerophosphatase A [Alphaproteobacteria bacterium]|nr:phosphatidylglycerophosphatase A [Alphaproteobacteria bacterium]
MIKIRNQDILHRLDFKHPATWTATWLGCGLLQPAPGTWGTLGGLPFGIFLLMTGGIPALVAAAIICFFVGLWAAKHFERMVREKDSGMIVIDEVVGIWIAMIPAVLTPLSIGLAFILFRLFDVWKPWPISYLDKKVHGAMGVMIDDVLAGIFAALVLIGLRHVGLG